MLSPVTQRNEKLSPEKVKGDGDVAEDDENADCGDDDLDGKNNDGPHRSNDRQVELPTNLRKMAKRRSTRHSLCSQKD